MSGLDEKGLRAAIFPNGENPLWTDMQRGAVDETISRVVRYLASATPADVGELVERLREKANKLDDMQGFSAPSGKLEREAATALERVVRERDEALRWAGCWHRICQTIATVLELPEPEADTFAASVRDKMSDAEAKLAEALARLETVEAETRELRARNDPMRVLGDPRVGVTIDEASLKELKRVLATIGGATP